MISTFYENGIWFIDLDLVLTFWIEMQIKMEKQPAHKSESLLNGIMINDEWENGYNCKTIN